MKNYGNGYCDYGCNNEECSWDGLDCESEPPKLADGSLTAVLSMDPEVITILVLSGLFIYGTVKIFYSKV